MKKTFLVLLTFFTTLISFAQTKSTVTGTVKDRGGEENVTNAVVALLSKPDSILTNFSRVKSNGSFEIKNVNPGNYVVVVMHPMFADLVDEALIKPGNNVLPSLVIIPKSKLMEEVIVKSGAPIRIKGDTTIYTADSFKVSANANVEELLKKLPGIQVDKNGQIKAMGETVQKVLVDGEEFFGDDPGMAVKNLRADAVQEVQVFDKKSDQAEFTGIDDGQTQKTINLKLKKDKKHGYFGKLGLAGGLSKEPSNRFNNNFMINAFQGDRKISGYVLNGNIGEDGLNWQDAQKFGGSNDNYDSNFDDESGVTFIMRSNASEVDNIDPDEGFLRNLNIGGVYSNKWKDTKLNISPRYNLQDFESNMNIYERTQTFDSTFIHNETDFSHINRYNYLNRAIFETKLDSSSSLKVTLNGNFYHSESGLDLDGNTVGANGNLKTSTTKNSNTNSDQSNLGFNATYRKKFKKDRRTISFSADASNKDAKSENLLKSNNYDYYYNDQQLIDQLANTKNNSTTGSAKVAYTEPISKNWATELSYRFAVTKGNNDQITHSNNGSNNYNVLVDSLTNQFDQNITQQIPGVKLNYSTKKLKFGFGTGLNFTNFNLTDVTMNKKYERNYTNFYPSANLIYSYKSAANLRFNYTGTTNQPSLNQLQPLRNNNNVFSQYIGNPNLRPSFNHNFNINHGTYNFLKDRWLFQNLNLNFINNAITTSQYIDPNSGKTISQPVNVDGNMMASSWIGMGAKIKKIDTRFQAGAFIQHTVTNNLLNNQKNKVVYNSIGPNISFDKSKDKKYELNLMNNLNFTSYKSDVSKQNTNYITNNFSTKAKVYIDKVWSIEGNYTNDYRQKTEQANGYSLNILDGVLSRNFRNDEFTASFIVKDIFNQNLSVDRNWIGNSTFKEQTYQRLKRYWMVGFTWNFKNKGAAPSKN